MKHYLIGKKNNVMGEITSDLYLNVLNKIAIRESMVTQVWDGDTGHSMELAWYDEKNNDEEKEVSVYWRYFGVVENGTDVEVTADAVRKLAKKRLSAVQIASELYCDIQAVKAIIEEHGIKLNPKKISGKELVIMWENGYSIDDICRVTGRVENNIRSQLLKLGCKAHVRTKKQRFVELFNKGVGMKQIANLIDSTEYSVNNMRCKCRKEGLIK